MLYICVSRFVLQGRKPKRLKIDQRSGSRSSREIGGKVNTILHLLEECLIQIEDPLEHLLKSSGIRCGKFLPWSYSRITSSSGQDSGERKECTQYLGVLPSSLNALPSSARNAARNHRMRDLFSFFFCCLFMFVVSGSPLVVMLIVVRVSFHCSQVCGVEGHCRYTCELAMSMLRSNKDALMAMLEAGNWTLCSVSLSAMPPLLPPCLATWCFDL